MFRSIIAGRRSRSEQSDDPLWMLRLFCRENWEPTWAKQRIRSREALALPTSDQQSFGSLDLWAKRTSEPKDQRSDGNRSTGVCPFGATAKNSRDRGVRFVCEPNKTGAAYELMIRYFNVFDRSGNLLELASGCSVQKTRPRYGPGTGSPFTCSSSMMILSRWID
jgi:hypothetical protein